MSIKRTLLLLTISCGVIFTSCDKKDDSDNVRDLQPSIQRVADSVYNALNDKWGIDKSGIHVYITGPSGTYQASSNITPKPTPESRFRVASISKTFTAAAIMLLHQEGELDINDFISEYLPNIPEYDIPYRDQITIKQLVQHRGGVFDVTNNEMPKTINAPYAGEKYEDYILAQDNQHTFTFDESVGLIAEHQLNTDVPDDGFYYSNSGYDILGKIIEGVSGASYSEFIDQRFIVPLGLTSTYCVWQGSDLEMRVPYIESRLYIEGEGSIATSLKNMSIYVTQGSIVSSPKDITTWIRLLLTGNAGINASNVELMKEMLPADVGHGVYGLGLVYDEGLGYGHNGALLSYISALRYNPDNGITVLISSNFIRVGIDDEDNESVYELGLGIRDACHALIREYQK